MDGLEAEAPPETEFSDQAAEADVTPESVEEDRFTDLTADEPEGGYTPEWLTERYKQMQADYTRKTQATAETTRERQEELDFLEALRSDPDTQRAVLEQLSEMLSGESDDEELIDDSDATDPMEERLAQLEQERNAEKAQALAREITSHIEQLAKDAGFELDEEDMRNVFTAATSDKVGRDQTAQAFKAYHDREQAKQDKWLKTYVASKSTASQQVPAGGNATEAPDLKSHEARVSRMAAILRGE